MSIWKICLNSGWTLLKEETTFKINVDLSFFKAKSRYMMIVHAYIDINKMET